MEEECVLTINRFIS